MVNPKHVAVALMIILVLLGTTVLGIAVIVSPAPPGSNDTRPDDDMAPGRVTALSALLTADNDQNVTAWKTGRANVTVASISSDFCLDGLSTAWVVTYQSDGQDAAVQVSGDKIKGIILSDRVQGSSLALPVVTTGLKDSDIIQEEMSDALTAAGREALSPSSYTLKAMIVGVYVWDIRCPVEGGYYLLTIDASTGEVKSEQYLKV